MTDAEYEEFTKQLDEEIFGTNEETNDVKVSENK